MTHNAHIETTACLLPAKLVKQWFGVEYRRQFRRGSVLARRADWAPFFLYLSEFTQLSPRTVSALVRATNSFPI